MTQPNELSSNDLQIIDRILTKSRENYLYQLAECGYYETIRDLLWIQFLWGRCDTRSNDRAIRLARDTHWLLGVFVEDSEEDRPSTPDFLLEWVNLTREPLNSKKVDRAMDRLIRESLRVVGQEYEEWAGE